MGSPLAWGCGHRATIPCFTAVVFVSLLSAISLKGKSKKDTFGRLQLPNGCLEATTCFVFSPDSYRPMQRNFVALMKTI